MRCPNCNHEVKEGMLFCQQCGTKIEAVRTQEEAVRTPTEAVRTPEEAVATPQAVNGQEGTIPTEKVQKSPVKNAPVEGGTFGWAVLGFLLFPIDKGLPLTLYVPDFLIRDEEDSLPESRGQSEAA